MKTTILHLTLALLVGTAVAQASSGEKGDRPPPPPVPPILAILDADHDEVISSKEIGLASTSLNTLDINGDGQITREELMPPHPENGNEPTGNKPPGPPPGHRPPPPVIVALDTNKDGALSAEEIKAAPEALLELDKNGDGELSIQELCPQGPPPPPLGEGPDGEP